MVRIQYSFQNALARVCSGAGDAPSVVVRHSAGQAQLRLRILSGLSQESGGRITRLSVPGPLPEFSKPALSRERPLVVKVSCVSSACPTWLLSICSVANVAGKLESFISFA